MIFMKNNLQWKNTISKLVFRCLVSCKKNDEMKGKVREVVKGVYKRDTENTLHIEGKMVFHYWESNFTTKENGLTLFCQPNNVKPKIEENSFPGKRFTSYRTEVKGVFGTSFLSSF